MSSVVARDASFKVGAWPSHTQRRTLGGSPAMPPCERHILCVRHEPTSTGPSFARSDVGRRQLAVKSPSRSDVRERREMLLQALLAAMLE